jgi:hypothetical protein
MEAVGAVRWRQTVRIALPMLSAMLVMATSIASTRGAAAQPARPATVDPASLPTVTINARTVAAQQRAWDANPGPIVLNGQRYGPLIIATGTGACLQPPAQTASFDRANLNDAQLAQYGLPPHPQGADAHALADWAQAVRTARTRTCTARAAIGASNTDDYHFAGHNYSGPYSYTDVWASFQVPCLISKGFQNDRMSMWTGLGAQGQFLVQDGITMHDYYIFGTDFPSYNLFYQTFGPNNTGGSEYDTYSVSCGDTIYAENWLPDNHFVEDTTTGQYSSAQEQWNGGNGAAEYILEAPGCSGSCVWFDSKGFGYFELPDFSTTGMYSMYMTRSGTTITPVGAQPHIGYWLLSEEYNVYCVEATAVQSGDWFNVGWYNECYY